MAARQLIELEAEAAPGQGDAEVPRELLAIQRFLRRQLRDVPGGPPGATC